MGVLWPTLPHLQIIIVDLNANEQPLETSASLYGASAQSSLASSPLHKADLPCWVIHP